MTEEMQKLVMRIEAAIKPNYQLEHDIWSAIGAPAIRPIPVYTASIDAAMTLVPEEWLVLSLSQIAGDGLAFAELANPFTSSTAIGVAKEMHTALCAAALRARVTP